MKKKNFSLYPLVIFLENSKYHFVKTFTIMNDLRARMQCAILNKSWKQHPTKQLLYGHLPLFSLIIQVRWTRHVGHCWRSKDKLINNVLLWTPTLGYTSVGWPALCEHWMQSRRPTTDDKGEGWMAWEGLGTTCCQHNLMMMMKWRFYTKIHSISLITAINMKL